MTAIQTHHVETHQVATTAVVDQDSVAMDALATILMNVPTEAITVIQTLRVKTWRDRSHVHVSPGFVVAVNTAMI